MIGEWSADVIKPFGRFKDRKKTFSGFACLHGEENMKQLELLHAWVHLTYMRPEIKESDYVTSMLYVLATNYQAWIEGVPLDPGGWGAIITKAVKSDYWLGTPLDVDMQFDRFEDGLAATLWAMYQKYGEQRKRRKGAD